MARTGRPPKLTPEVQDSVLKSIRLGAYIETAVLQAGISKKAFYNWLHRGRKARKGMYHDFVHAVEKAMAYAEERDLAIVHRAAAGQQEQVVATRTFVDATGTHVTETVTTTRTVRSWQAAAWKLERRHKKRWGRTLGVGGMEGGPLRVRFIEVPDWNKLPAGGAPAIVAGDDPPTDDQDTEGTGADPADPVPTPA